MGFFDSLKRQAESALKREVSQGIMKSFFQKPTVRLFLNLKKIRYLEYLVYLGKAHSGSLTELMGLYHFSSSVSAKFANK